MGEQPIFRVFRYFCFALLREFLLAVAGWPAPPKGTKKSCPYIRVSLRETSLIPSLLRGSPCKGHPWPFTALAASMPLALYVAITFGLLKGAIDVACKSVIARIQYEGKP